MPICERRTPTSSANCLSFMVGSERLELSERYHTWASGRRQSLSVIVSCVTEPNPDERLRRTLSQWRPSERQGDPQANIRPDSGLTGAKALELFDAQLTSRHLDLTARRLRAADAGFYTISSAGHEGNAAVAAALRPTDPALLHYRS